MNIALVLVHNKSNVENNQQIENLKSKLTEIRVDSFFNDENGNQIPTIDPETGIQKTHLDHYILTGLPVEHQIKVFQIIPFGVEPPANLYTIDSHKVFYGVGDEDKVGNHPRFFNWGLKRGTDYGADIALYIDDMNKFVPQKLIPLIQTLDSPNDPTEFADKDFGKLATFRLLKEVGQLKEDRSLSDAVADLKIRVTQKGFKNG